MIWQLRVLDAFSGGFDASMGTHTYPHTIKNNSFKENCGLSDFLPLLTCFHNNQLFVASCKGNPVLFSTWHGIHTLLIFGAATIVLGSHLLKLMHLLI